MKLNKKRYAILCSGGNSPGMASCVLAFIKKCLSIGVEPVAFSYGFHGLHNDEYLKLPSQYVINVLDNGSALIGTSRCNEFATSEKYRLECVKVLKKHKIDALVVVGGDGSCRGALALSKLGVKVITIPATIDNDVPSTTYTVGFDTCLNTICSYVSDANDVLVSHHGIGLIEVMGKGCPDVTVRSGIANNATYIVTKYSKLKRNDFLAIAKRAFKKGKPCVTFLITEKLYSKSGPNSLGQIAKWLEEQTGEFARHIVLGYVQRGGKPSARDRLLANYMINIGVNELAAGRHSLAICRKARQTIACDLTQAVNMKRRSWNKELVKTYNKINQE